MLLAGGGGISLTLLLTPFVSHAPATPSGALLIGLQNLGFFAADLAITALLLTFPSGTLQRRWHGTALLILTALAVLTELLLLFAAPRMSIDRSGPTGVALANPLAIPGLASLEPVIEALWNSTLVWPLVGLVVLIDRIRTADRERRRELRPVLGGIAVLVLLVILQLLAIAAGLRLQDPRLRDRLPTRAGGVAGGAAGRDLRPHPGPRRGALSVAHPLAAAEDRVRPASSATSMTACSSSWSRSCRSRSWRGESSDAARPSRPLRSRHRRTGAGGDGELRELVSGIRPPVLKDAGVVAALEGRLAPLPADVELDARRRSGRWADTVEAALLRGVRGGHQRGEARAGARRCGAAAPTAATSWWWSCDDGPGLPRELAGRSRSDRAAGPGGDRRRHVHRGPRRLRRDAAGRPAARMSALRVVVADDNFLVREGIRRLLLDGDDVDVVADAASAPELLARVREHRPAAVLTDIRMPPHAGMDGVRAALTIRAELTGTGVVVLSQHADAAYARALFADGTAGLAYLLKETVATGTSWSGR